MVSEQAFPSAPKSADRIEGAMIAGGDMMGGSVTEKHVVGKRCRCSCIEAPMGVLKRAVEITNVIKTHDDCVVLMVLAR
jgi:hypothetical protein